MSFKYKENLTKIRLNVLVNLVLIFSPLLFIICLVGHIFYYFLFLIKRKKCVSGQLALITGGGNGLGRCIARKLAETGCNIAVVDWDMLGAEETVQIIKNNFKNVIVKAYKVNVANHEEVKRLQVDVENDFNQSVDILVNNAGVFGIQKNNVLPPEEIRKMIEVNLMSHIWMVMAFVKQMKLKKSGHIVAISSLSALLPSSLSVYAASKVAIRGFMKCCEVHLGRRHKSDNVKTTTVYPYFLNTNPKVLESVQTFSNQLYPAIDGMTAADIIVNGIRKNASEIIIPRAFGSFYWLSMLLPLPWQKWLFI